MMMKMGISRRNFGAAACLVAVAIPESGNVQAGTCLSAQNLAIIHKHRDAWLQKDWHAENMLLADDFTFSSPNNDDHISKARFKTRCWDNNVNDMKSLDMVHIYGGADDALVLYNLLTTDNKTIRNVEYYRFRNGQIISIECFFGAPSNFPAAVDGISK